MDALIWLSRPTLRRPVIIASFEGWNDAADASSSATQFLAEAWHAELFAQIDPETFHDFTTVRPEIHLNDDDLYTIGWPTGDFTYAELPGLERDVVLLHGIEPQLRWRSYCEQVTTLADVIGAELIVTLGSLIADVPHTRPISMTGVASDKELAQTIGLQQSTYEGPTGIVGVLHEHCRAYGMRAASMWAAVPHYVAQNPSPRATLALVERCTRLLDVSVELTELELASAEYDRQVAEVVESDPDIAEYVRQLEQDESDDVEIDPAATLAAEAERFLRDHRRPNG